MYKIHDALRKLPQADINIKGAELFISQGKGHQIVFMEFDEDINIPEHKHSDQIEFVLSGQLDLYIANIKKTYTRGDQFFVPSGTLHSAKVYKGYSSIGFFDEAERYKIK